MSDNKSMFDTMGGAIVDYYDKLFNAQTAPLGLIKDKAAGLEKVPMTEAQLDAELGPASDLKDAASVTSPSVDCAAAKLSPDVPSFDSLALKHGDDMAKEVANASANARALGIDETLVTTAAMDVDDKGSVGGAAQQESSKYASAMSSMSSSKAASMASFATAMGGLFGGVSPGTTGAASEFASVLGALDAARMGGMALDETPCKTLLKNAIASNIVANGMTSSLSGAGLSQAVISSIAKESSSGSVLNNFDGVQAAFASKGIDVTGSKADASLVKSATMDSSKVPNAVSMDYAIQIATALTNDYGKSSSTVDYSLSNRIAALAAQEASNSTLLKKFGYSFTA